MKIAVRYSVMAMAFISLISGAKAQETMGHDVGNGIDNVAWASGKPGMAWFQTEVTADRKIKVCLEVNERKFGYSKETLVSLVESSIQKWKDYAAGTGRNILVAFDAEIRANCGLAAHDLKIFFGETDRNVEKHLGDFTHPVGFSVLTDFDLKQAWGKGFIYIAPNKTTFKTRKGVLVKMDWQSPNKLEGALTHELGHVFGVAHVDGTIMDAVDLEDNLLDDYTNSPEYQAQVRERLAGIDGRMKLLFDQTGVDSYDFDLTRMSRQGLIDASFRAFLGRDSLSKAQGRVDFSAVPVVNGARRTYLDATVMLSDTEGQINIPLRVGTAPVAHDSLALAFATLKSGYAMGGLFQIATAYLPDGRKLRLHIKRSMNFERLEISMIDDEFRVKSLVLGK